MATTTRETSAEATSEMALRAHDSEDTQTPGQEQERAQVQQQNQQQNQDDTFQGLATTKVILLVVSSLLSTMLVALDRTIVSTAIPKITDEFNSLPDVGWYGSAYMMTCGAFQLVFGKLYTFYPAKGVLFMSLLVFEVGSAICGAAPTSTAFIVGRALAGVGAAGALNGCLVTIVYSVPLKRRPAVQGAMGAFFGLSTMLGPLIGGAFTSHVTWRWCFYINLPIGGVTMAIVALFLKIPRQDSMNVPWKKKMWGLDPLGCLFLIPSLICLTLALQWGGETYAWNSGRIIALLTLMSALFVAFVAVEIIFPDTALIPPRIFKIRSIWAGWWEMTFLGAGMYILIYYLPIWFQTVKGDSAIGSGVKILPFMISFIIAAGIYGGTVQKTGYYVYAGIFGACLMVIGSGLLTTLEVNSNAGHWIGYQVVFGFGMGASAQTPSLAAQVVLPNKDVPIAIALGYFGQLIGGSVSLPAGENVLDNKLISELSGFPGFEPSLVTSGGATALIDALGENLRPQVIQAYNEALRWAFRVGLIFNSLIIIGAVLLENKNTRRPPPKEGEIMEDHRGNGNDMEKANNTPTANTETE